jgi:copper chaperone CopZ
VQTKLAISGMHCGSCVAKIQKALTPLANDVKVQLDAPQAVFESAMPISLAKVNAALAAIGSYKASGWRDLPKVEMKPTEPAAIASPAQTWLTTYKPLLIIVGFITVISALAAWREVGIVGQSMGSQSFAQRWMSDFMAGFFLVFGFFKLLDIPAFAKAYAGYDLIAQRWSGWGYVYPFCEIALGIAYLVRWNPLVTNLATIVLMGTAICGVIAALANKRKIQCACLGAVFNLPMSTVTLVEDGLMIAMAVMAVAKLV